MQTPMFLASKVRPIMMLNMSRDQQLFLKLYDDYADITDADGGKPDGIPDTTYNNNFDYYGYFDSNKCYEFINNPADESASYFSPKSFAVGHYCSDSRWSGNFLNWATMTRMDAIRKILYGGYRAVDGAKSSFTILERALLPNDAHSFVKYYTGSDINRLTPLPASSEGVTFCNTSVPLKWKETRSTEAVSQDQKTYPTMPVMRVQKGNYSLWASGSRYQCLYYKEDLPDQIYDFGKNGNDPNKTGLAAAASSPYWPPLHYKFQYQVRVQTCLPALIDDNNDEQCRRYNSNGRTIYKPAGLLQQYGENDAIHFGLMTGSWGKRRNGGVLRKNTGTFTDEVNEDGTFKPVPEKGGIVNALDSIGIYGYYWHDGVYYDWKEMIDKTTNKKIKVQVSCQQNHYVGEEKDKNHDNCLSWSNPQAEIYLESLRYLAGKQPNKDFWFDDDKTNTMPGMIAIEDWVDPITSGVDSNYCAPLNILQFNTSSSSYDTDDLTKAQTDFSLNIDEYTNAIGEAENIHGNEYFVGENGIDNNQVCTAKTVTKLGDVKGSCPDAPRLKGGYDMAGLAYWARKEFVGTGREKVKTFGVALAPAVPKVEVLVPGKSNGEKITIIPACKNTKTGSACQNVGFQVVSRTVSEDGSKATGKLYINWDDVEEGADFDMDAWGKLEYEVTNTKVKVTTQVFKHSSAAAFGPMGFGYIINGTTQDGFHAHSGILGYSYIDPTGALACDNCGLEFKEVIINRFGHRQWRWVEVLDDPTSYTYNIGSSKAEFLESALFYAAKWGGYADDEMTESDIAARNPENNNYFYATEPKKLKEALGKAFDAVSKSQGSSAAAAANSTRLSGGTLAYQARFNAEDWSGQIVAYPISSEGHIDMKNKPVWDTHETLAKATTTNRKIYTYDGDTIRNNEIQRELVQLTDNNWENNALPTLKSVLSENAAIDSIAAKKRFKWLLGEDDSSLRSRKYLLGDIVNADPAYAGMFNQVHNKLPDEYGSGSYLTYVRKKNNQQPILFVGANDGMLHALDAQTGEEVFAYIPRGAYAKLNGLMDVDFTHQFIVDGSLYVGDAYLQLDALRKEWRTIVVGSLGYGGRGVFALDVTDALEKREEPKVLFDFTSTDSDSPIADDLGFILNKPIVVPTADGHWRVIFGNGVNSAHGTAKLIAINLDDPKDDVVVLDTKAKYRTSTDNGLSGVSLLPNSSGVTLAAYGGDILGNMWKFDLANMNNDDWKVAYGKEDRPEPLITVIDSENNPQPISTTPTLGYNYLKRSRAGSDSYAVMVYFVTGKYYTSEDAVSDKTQSVYAIADEGRSYDLSWRHRNQFLHQKRISKQTSTKRTIANDKNVNWDRMNGWYLDLVQPDDETNGERGVSKTLLMYNRLIFATFTPSSNQCDFGGGGWLMELNAVNGVYDDDTEVLEEESNTYLEAAILSDLTPLIGEQGGPDIIGSSLGDGELDPPLETFSGNGVTGIRGRVSWRELH